MADELDADSEVLTDIYLSATSGLYDDLPDDYLDGLAAVWDAATKNTVLALEAELFEWASKLKDVDPNMGYYIRLGARSAAFHVSGRYNTPNNQEAIDWVSVLTEAPAPVHTHDYSYLVRRTPVSDVYECNDCDKQMEFSSD